MNHKNLAEYTGLDLKPLTFLFNYSENKQDDLGHTVSAQLEEDSPVNRVLKFEKWKSLKPIAEQIWDAKFPSDVVDCTGIEGIIQDELIKRLSRILEAPDSDFSHAILDRIDTAGDTNDSLIGIAESKFVRRDISLG